MCVRVEKSNWCISVKHAYHHTSYIYNILVEVSPKTKQNKNKNKTSLFFMGEYDWIGWIDRWMDMGIFTATKLWWLYMEMASHPNKQTITYALFIRLNLTISCWRFHLKRKWFFGTKNLTNERLLHSSLLHYFIRSLNISFSLI